MPNKVNVCVSLCVCVSLHHRLLIDANRQDKSIGYISVIVYTATDEIYRDFMHRINGYVHSLIDVPIIFQTITTSIPFRTKTQDFEFDAYDRVGNAISLPFLSEFLFAIDT